MAAIDPIAFLRATHPFCDLPAPLFDPAARALEIAFFPAGTRLVERGGQPLRHLYVIRKGSVRLEGGGQTLQILEEGEIFGYTSLITRQATMDALVEEDLLAYRLPAAEFSRLLGDAQFAGHFASGLAERLAHSLARSPLASFDTNGDLSVAVETRARSAPVRVPASATVGDAARAMRAANVGSVIVDGDPAGIVTDRDFRDKVLAAGLGPDTPLLRVCSRPLRTVPAGTAVYEAWQKLLDFGVHHLPIEREGEIVGVLSSADLLRSTGPLRVLRTVERLDSRGALPGYAVRVTEMISSLLTGGLDPTVIAGFVARLNDALLKRILQWAEQDLGPAPAPYAWIALGSEGRQEQTLLTDQDNALVHGGGEGMGRYFARLADRANEDLQAAGFPACAGGYMARRWHGPLEEWEARFRGWLGEPRPEALLQAAIFFDFRKVCGGLDLAPLEAVLARAGKERLFLARMAKAALAFGPPASLFLRLRGEQADLKAHGISPIVFLARPYALEVGSTARNTLERLDAAVTGGIMSADQRSTLRETYRFLLGLRLKVQLGTLRRGGKPVNTLLPSELTSIERSRLKDAFRAIADWQGKAAFHYRADML
jgi:CBS domain-containing protein